MLEFVERLSSEQGDSISRPIFCLGKWDIPVNAEPKPTYHVHSDTPAPVESKILVSMSARMAETAFTSYAQNMEDIRLWRALRHISRGRYIDIGAWDPRIDSVSRGFYEQGWRGWHFEPQPGRAAQLRADRPDEPVYEVALSDHEGSMKFYLVGDAGTSSGILELAQAASKQGDLPKEISVPVTTLARHFANQELGEVHWLKLDVEGMEPDVLRGWDSTTLRPWIFVIEATSPLNRAPCHEAFESILLDASYLPAGFDGVNCYYVAKEHADLVERVQVPVSVFDLMDGCRLSDNHVFAQWQMHQLWKIRSSLSWKLAKPLRMLEAYLRNKPEIR